MKAAGEKKPKQSRRVKYLAYHERLHLQGLPFRRYAAGRLNVKDVAQDIKQETENGRTILITTVG